MRCLLPSILLLLSASIAAAFPSFVPHPLGDSALGLTGFRETLSPVDLDADGDMDFFTGQGMGGDEWWFENRGGGDFLPRLVSDSNDADVGAAIADVDGDGDMDRIAGGFLYRNLGGDQGGREPRQAGALTFRAERTGAPQYTHDLLAGDFDKDGWPDFVVVDYAGIQWHRNPGKELAEWPAVIVAKAGLETLHGGIGVGDFDGDGDADISLMDRWFENRDSGKTWERKPGPAFGQSDPGLYGLSGRTVAADIDKDGDVDLFQAECDVKNGRVAWFENRDKGNAWVTHMIKDSVAGQDFHSLSLAELDGDGDLDLFSGGASLSGEPEGWYAWENLDGAFGKFAEHILWPGATRGAHEGVAMDVDGDGDLDILAKEFGLYHTWLENRRIHTGIAPDKPGRGRSVRGVHIPVFGYGKAVDALGRRLRPSSP